jgi:hypothetical protein
MKETSAGEHYQFLQWCLTPFPQEQQKRKEREGGREEKKERERERKRERDTTLPTINESHILRYHPPSCASKFSYFFVDLLYEA